MIKRVALSSVDDAPEEGIFRAQVIVVDDSATIRKILETCLRRAGYRVESFSDGVEALRWLVESHAIPDLVILDVNLPKMDGFEVARRLKLRPNLGNVSMIMLTRRNGVIDKLKGRLAGAKDYLSKPFKTEELLTVIESHLPPGEHMHRSEQVGGDENQAH
jgi:twitching motility two-component system response regulator PilG